MRIADLPTRDIDGIAYPDVPIVRRDDPRWLPIGAAFARVRLRALGVGPGASDGGEGDGGLAAAFASLDAILAGVDDLDPGRMDDPRVGDLADRLALWHETVWYPKGEALGEAWAEAIAGVRRPQRPVRIRLEEKIIDFCEDIPEIVARHGRATRGFEDNAAVARLMEGRGFADVVRDAGLSARIQAVGERRARAAAEAARRTVADLVAECEAALARDGDDEPWFEVVVEMSADGEPVAAETHRVRASGEEAARARALVLARDGMFDHGRVPDRVSVLSVARADLPTGFAP